MAELDIMLKAVDSDRIGLFPDFYLGLQNLVYTLHRSQSFGYIVTGLGKLFQRIDNTVEYGHVINEGGTTQYFLFQYKYSAKPQDDDNHYRTQKLAHGVGQLLTDIDAHDIVAIG